MTDPRRATFALPSADIHAAPAARTLSGLAVPFGTVAQRMGTDVTFTAGGLRLPDDLSHVKLLIQHDDDRPVGYAVAAVEHDDGLTMTFRLPPSARGDAVLAEVDTLLRDGLSVGVELDPAVLDEVWSRLIDGDSTGDGPLTLTGELRECSLVTVPQYDVARVAAAGALATFTVPRSTTAPEAAVPVVSDPTVTAPAPAEPAGLTLEQLAAELAPRIHAAAPAHPLARFASYDDYAAAVWAGQADRLALVLADQITANNPGVSPPAWLTAVVGVLDAGRPFITALGGPRSLPDGGMSISYPYYDGDPLSLVDVQATQKTEVTTGRVDIKAGTAPIATYAGASDISYQLLRRSSPSYREVYQRILAIAYAARTEHAASNAAVTAATGAGTVDAAGDADAFRSALFAASADVQDVTGRPADVVGVASDVFVALGGLGGLWPGAYGTQNVAGTAQASTLEVNVSGLRVVRLRYVPDGTCLVTNSEAFTFYEDGPFPVSADDVAKLGLDVGVWGMGASVASLPAGIVKITGAPVIP